MKTATKRGLPQRLTILFEFRTPVDATSDVLAQAIHIPITDEPTPADIQRAHDLIAEHGWTHLLSAKP